MRLLRVLIILFLGIPSTSFACSFFKITRQGHTLVGCNEDAWRTTPHLWFESRSKKDKYGAAFTGSRWDGTNGFAPQSGMNEKGLIFSRLAAYRPNRSNPNTKRPQIANQTEFLKKLLHQCQTIQEVQLYVNRFNRETFAEDVLIFVQKNGDYLIVEPYSTQIGDQHDYVLSNFCPSATPERERHKLERYHNGVTFLKNQPQPISFEFGLQIADTMHVCRPKIGDGTLLTSIWNPQTLEFQLFFYHNYSDGKNFNLKKELELGNHQIALTSIFPSNNEFETFKNYYTTQTHPELMFSFLGLGVLYCLSSIYFLTSFVMRRKQTLTNIRLILAIFFGCMGYFMYVLLTNPGIFYFKSPYIDPLNWTITATSFLPYCALLCTILLVLFQYRMYIHKWGSRRTRLLLSIHTLLLIGLLFAFNYWHFFTLPF